MPSPFNGITDKFCPNLTDFILSVLPKTSEAACIGEENVPLGENGASRRSKIAPI